MRNEIRKPKKHYKRKGRKSKAEKRARSIKRAQAFTKFLSFIGANPYLAIFILAILVIFGCYMAVTVDTYLTDLMASYQSLSARVNNSKNDFDKKVFYIVTKEDGSKEIHIGYQSAVQEEESKRHEGITDPTETGAETEPATESSTPPSWGGEWDIDELAAILEKHSVPSSKSHCLAYAYFYFKDKNPTDFTDETCAGIMGNVILEGAPGVIESLVYTKSKIYSSPVQHDCPHLGRIWSCNGHLKVPGFCDSSKHCVHAIAYKNSVLDTQDDWEILYKIGAATIQPGVGMAQWSGNRRVALLDKYKARGVITASQSDKAYVEIEYMYDELMGSESKYFAYFKGKSGGVSVAEDCGYLCRKWYERPAKSSEYQRAKPTARNCYESIVEYNSKKGS